MNTNLLNIWHVLMSCIFIFDIRKLPKFNGNFPKDEYKENDKQIQPEIKTSKSLKEYLTNELKDANVVYERIYPNSLLMSERNSLFFTELFSSNVPETYLGRELSEETMSPYYVPKDGDDTLIFESRFESGNLKLCIKKSETEYDLYLQNDVNTYGNVQWFFFKVSNTKKNATIYFNIKNMVFYYISIYRQRMIRYSVKECDW